MECKAELAHIIGIRIYPLGVNKTLDGGIVPLADTDADPDVTVDAHYDVHTEWSTRRRQGMEVGF